MNWDELLKKFTQNGVVTELSDNRYTYLALMMCIAGLVMLLCYLFRSIKKHSCFAKVTGQCFDVKSYQVRKDLYWTCDYAIEYRNAKYALYDVPFSGGAVFAGPAKAKVPEKGHTAKLRIRLKGDKITECWTRRDDVQQAVMLFIGLMFIGVALFVAARYTGVLL